MRLETLTAAVYGAIDPAGLMADVAAVCEHDRYQASAGIDAAAAYVAERARAAGLAGVEILTFPADGARRWWTYDAPRSWTPLRARLRVGPVTLVRYPEQPYTLAAYSAATAPGGQPAGLVRWSAVRAGASPAGSVVVVDEPVALGPLLGPLTAAGALALAADPLGRAVPEGREPNQVGRLELPPGSALAAFSVTAGQLRELIAAADAGTAAVVEVATDTAPRPLPVVTGLLPGRDEGELLLCAHLCHPRPGANDNASGVAALLGLARALTVLGLPAPGPDLRFLWGPEFTGVAAYLHDVVGAGLAPVPSGAISVDMAGEDVRRCGGPLVIERGPDDLPSFLPALAERCAALLPPAARSYSGAVPCDPWTWRTTPFAGGSDHALLADAPTRCPAIALGHWPDRLNHSSADTAGAIDPAELRRSAAVAGAVMAGARAARDPELAGDIAAATIAWGADHVLATLPGRRLPAGGGAPDETGGPVLDISSEPGATRWRAHRTAVALAAVGALSPTAAPAAQLAAGSELITSIAAAGPRAAPAAQAPGPGVLARSWEGPVNLRALTQAATEPDRNWLDQELARDRGGNYARALALLRALDGRRDQTEAAWWAALSSELPLPVTFAQRLLDLVVRAGWARPVHSRASGEPAIVAEGSQ